VKPLIPFVDRDIADVPKSIDLSLIKTDFLPLQYPSFMVQNITL